MQLAKIRNIVMVSLFASMVTGCSNSSDLGAIKEGFTEKPDTYDGMMKEANRMAAAGNIEKALLWYHNAIANAESEFGPNDGRVANAAMYDAALARSNNKLGEAEEMYKRAYDIQLKLSGPNSSSLNDVKKAYAETLVDRYKLDEARKIDPQVKTPSDYLKASNRSKSARHKH